MKVGINRRLIWFLILIFFIPLTEKIFSPKSPHLPTPAGRRRENLSPEMERIVQEVRAGRNVLILGNAGTGKSSLLKYLRQKIGRNVAVVAMTGAAAVNVGGRTIHSLFRIGDNFQQDLESQKIRMPADLRMELEAIDLLLIDEISTVRPDLLDQMDRILRRAKKSDRPFGGLQLVLCGDLHQLPPVISRGQSAALAARYGWPDPLFFDAFVFRDLRVQCFELQRIFRQKNGDFLRALQNIATGEDVDDALRYFNGRVRREEELPADAVRITARRRAENIHNEKRLQSTPGDPIQYPARIDGSFRRRLEKDLPSPKMLELKRNVPVVFTKNGTLWQNGTRGEVVRLGPDRIAVRLLQTGKKVDVGRAVWRDVIYKNGRREILGTFSQFPLRLAYAMTIHRAQGQTLDRVILDKRAGDSFACGQIYTALSRVRNIEDLFLTDELTADDVKVAPRIKRFMEWCLNRREALPEIAVEKNSPDKK